MGERQPKENEETRKGGRTHPGGGEKSSVDDAGEGLYSRVLDGDDEGRRGGGVGTETELRVVGANDCEKRREESAAVRGGGVAGRGHTETSDEDTEDVEEEDADVDILDGTGEGLARVLGLTGGDGDDLGSDVGEGGLDEDGEETEEATESAVDAHVLNHGSGVAPVLGTDVLAVGASSAVEDDTEDDKTDNGDDPVGGGRKRSSENDETPTKKRTGRT